LEILAIMSVASVDDLREELSFTEDQSDLDVALLTRHLAAAEAMIERSLGFTFAEQYPEPAEVPAPLKQGVLWLALDYYEGRGNPEKGNALPVHVEQIVTAYREWSF
jgi:hypothetical protein